MSEKSLNKNVIRKVKKKKIFLRNLKQKKNVFITFMIFQQKKGNDKVNTGERLLTLTEEDVFKYLNLTYRKPEERDF